MYPLLLKPAMKSYLWGGTRLGRDFGYGEPGETAAEAWVLSGHRDGPSVVTNGPLRGQTLSAVLAVWGPASMGRRAAKRLGGGAHEGVPPEALEKVSGTPADRKTAPTSAEFPLLVKLIDARDRLSIQVHPDDAYAWRVEGEPGKTEMWYVVDCVEGASLIYGFSKVISKEEYRRRIEDGTLEEVLHRVKVQKGDRFFIEAGTLHAIGAGILIAEVQQSSNTTYRVSDYGRLGADGKPRLLHIDKAVDVTKTVPAPSGEAKVPVQPTAWGGERPLASCPYFTAAIWDLQGERPVGTDDSFTGLLCLEGEARLQWEQEELLLPKGASLFLPAGLRATVTGEAQLLYTGL